MEDRSPRYEDPWILPFEERLVRLKRRSTKVAYYYDRADNSTFRYRVYNPVCALNALDSGVSASFFFREDLPHWGRVIDAADQLVVSRSKYTHELNELIARFKAVGKTVLYDIDDLVFDIRYAPLIGESIGIDLREDRGWDTWFAYVSRHGAALQLCDGCITTNRHLGARIEQYANLPVRLMRNFMNEEQLQVSAQTCEKRRRDGQALKDRRTIWLGYFSGTPTHLKDFEIARPAILQLMKEDPRIHLLVAGYMSVQGVDERLKSRIRHQPFTDYVNLQRIIGSVDVNLIPLVCNYFTDCKSELKFFEAAAVLTPSVASPTATYRDCIRSEDNALLAPAHEWQARLERLIEDAALYRRLVQRGHETAMSQYTWATRLDEILSALGLSSPGMPEPSPPAAPPLASLLTET